MQHVLAPLKVPALGIQGSRQDRAFTSRHQSSHHPRRRFAVSAAAKDENDKSSKPLWGKAAPTGKNLEERIASGEFDDSGSTKEKLTRPMRKLLAKDSMGPGKCAMRHAEALHTSPASPQLDHI